MIRHRLTAALLAAAGLGALAATASAAASGATSTTTTLTPTPTASDWNLGAISPADGATVASGKPMFRWSVPAADRQDAVYLLADLRQDTKVTAAGKLVAVRQYQGVGDTLPWSRTSYRWSASPLLAGTYAWQIQATSGVTNEPDDMPVHTFTVPAHMDLGRVHEWTQYPTNAPALVSFLGNLTGNVNDADSMGEHPKDPKAQYVCQGTVVLKRGGRVVFTGHEKQDCSSPTTLYGQLVMAFPDTKIHAPAGSKLTGRVTVSGDGISRNSNTFSFSQP